MDAAPVFRMSGVSKRYGGVHALEDARIEIRRGRIHAVLGENGAGKSTLIKIMAGVVQPDSGTMELDGRAIRFRSPVAATEAGIACIFQELSLLPHLTVADNISIIKPPQRFGLIDRQAQRRIAEKALARAGAPDIHPLARVMDLPLSRRQMVEIAKALARDPKILILDEATSALTASDVATVFAVLKQLRARRSRRRLHLASHARDRRSRRRVHGLSERALRRDLRGPHQERRSGRRDDDRPRVQEHLPAASRDEARGSPGALDP